MAELSTHDNQRVTKALNDGLQAALTGTKTPDAGDEGRAARGRAAPAAVQEVSRARPRAGPAPDAAARSHDPHHAMALRLAAAAAGRGAARRCSRTTRRSPRSGTASSRRRRAARPARVRRRSTTTGSSSTTRSSGRRSSNNLWFALGTIPASIALAIADGAVGQRAASPAAASCAWPTSRRPMLPMIAVANIWLFFYTPRVRAARAVHSALFGAAEPQLARQQEHGARLR